MTFWYLVRILYIFRILKVSPGVMLDLDADGNLVGLEVLNASKKLGK